MHYKWKIGTDISSTECKTSVTLFEIFPTGTEGEFRREIIAIFFGDDLKSAQEKARDFTTIANTRRELIACRKRESDNAWQRAAENHHLQGS